MDIQTLQKHVLTLATIEETDAPMVSCYLNLEKGLAAARRILDERVRLLRRTIPAPQRDSFEHALLAHRVSPRGGFPARRVWVPRSFRGTATRSSSSTSSSACLFRPG